MADLSLIVVTYRSAGVAGEAVASFRAQAAERGLAAEVIVVDHSEEEAEAERLRALAPERLLLRPNRGYAAGLNVGIAEAAGEVLLLANPDLRLEPGALGALLAALDDGWDVAGPQFTLAGFLFPPAEVQTPGEELRRRLAALSPRLWRRHMAREVLRWRRVWEAPEPVAVPALSGALLAVEAATLRRLGLWDEGYFLYFEETDWLERARRAGLSLAVVPAARVRHAWAHAAPPGDYEAVFAASRRRFFERWYGRRGRWAAALPAPRPRIGTLPLPPPEALPASPDLLWLLSPSPLGFPAAGAWRVTGPIHDAVARFAAERSYGGTLTVAAFDPPSGHLHGPWIDCNTEP